VLPSDCPTPPERIFFTLEIMKQPDLQQGKNVLETPKAACLPQLQRKSISGPGFQNAEEIYATFDFSEKSVGLQALIHTQKKIYFLISYVLFSSTGLEHNVILCMVAHTANELLQCAWEEGLKRFMHYKTSVCPHFAFNIIVQHKHRIVQIKLEISHLFSPALLTNNVMCFSAL